MNWLRTKYVLHRLEDKISQEIYEGRPIIQRDSPIDGGVYLGGHEREAIVVDSVKYPLIGQVYDEVKALCLGEDYSSAHPFIILGTVFNTVKLRLRYSEEETKKIIEERGAVDDHKISLGAFLERQYGVCRQQALLAAFLLEKFIKEGYLEGKVSVDRNSWVLGAHAWCRYTDKKGEVIILDPAKDFIGSLEASIQCGKWDYRRERDRKGRGF
ncbi:hypothetical protein HZC30_01450 [Candidatus Woesearchaeota archaeon]|nr:hypothetical protein [Candidatus Woesearchaeota archaeon]